MLLNIFCPNGVSSLNIIYKLAREEFGDIIKDGNSYVSIKRDIVRALRKMNSSDLEENKLDTLVGIQHLKENDFGNFVSIRFAHWGMVIAIAIMIIGDVPIYQYFDMDKRSFGSIVIILLTILLIITSRTIHIQHNQLEYLNFKLICFDEIIGNRKKN